MAHKGMAALNKLAISGLISLLIGSSFALAQSGSSPKRVDDIFAKVSDQSSAVGSRQYYGNRVRESALGAGRRGCDSPFDIDPVARADACNAVGRVLAEATTLMQNIRLMVTDLGTDPIEFQDLVRAFDEAN